MSEALLRDLAAKVDRIAENQAALTAEYVEGKRNAKEVARTTTGRIDEIASKVDGMDRRSMQDSSTLGEVLAQQKQTNGRVNRHDDEIEELQRDRDIAAALARVRSWRFPATVAFIGSVASGTTVAVIALLIR